MTQDVRQPPVLQPHPGLPAPPGPGAAAVLSWVLALPCAPAGLVLGVVALRRERRRGGAGWVHAVVGTTASATVLALGGAATAVALVVGSTWGGDDLLASRGHDDTVTSLSAAEQGFVDALYQDTYDRFDDATLLRMGYAVCDAMDDGGSPPQADAQLLDTWGELDLDTAYDVEYEATHHLCPAHGDAFELWDPATTDPGAAGASDAAVGTRQV